MENEQSDQKKLKDRDHKKLGRELDLYYIDSVVGKGLPMFTEKGSVIRRKLERFIVDEEIKRGYNHVYTPDIAKLELYEQSGHYQKYRDSMYAPIEIDDEKFMLRPMSCPHHFRLYQRHPHSYRELPLRIAEIAKLYRYEQSGELMGLQRVRTFSLADAHIICKSEEEAIEEIGGALDLIEHIAGTFGLEYGTHYHYRLSLSDKNDTEKYEDDPPAWEKSESLMRTLLQKRGRDFKETEGDAAFYGPKIDVQMTNVNGKEDTAFTVQYDFSMPKKFHLTYVGEDGEEHQPFVVHRSSIGAIERIMAFLIEHYNGAFPLWLSPVQVAVLPIGETQKDYAQHVVEKLREEGIRVELRNEDETLGKRIRNTKLQKIPYFLVIGDEEVKKEEVMVESRNDEKIGQMDLPSFVEKLRAEGL